MACSFRIAVIAAAAFAAPAEAQKQVVLLPDADDPEGETRAASARQQATPLPTFPKVGGKAPPPQAAPAGTPRTTAAPADPPPPPAATPSFSTGRATDQTTSSAASSGPRQTDSGATQGVTTDAQSPRDPSHQDSETKKDDTKSGDAKKEEPKQNDDLSMSAKWNHGLELTSTKKDFRVHVGGRYQFDTVWYDAPDGVQTGPGGVGLLQDGFSFRRARFRIDGTMYDTYEWAAEFDFVNGTTGATTPSINSPAVTDLYVEFTKIPALGALRVGHFKEPYSFEHLTSSRWLHFLERSPNFDPFAERFYNGFTPGIMLHNTYDCERGTWWLGVFHDTTVPFGFGVGDQNYAYDARVTYLPLWDECAHQYVHVGAAYSHRNLVNERVRLRSRPSVRSSPPPLTPFLADTGFLASTIQDLANIELVAVSGPWTFQSEYYASWVQDASAIPAAAPVGAVGAPLGTLFFTGWYAEALYFLTGETREYNKKAANFGRVVPRRNLRWAKEEGACDQYCNSTGAWQVGARFSHTDLQDGGVGSVLDDWTLGLNWYFNPNMKVQWNYVATHRRGPAAEDWIYGFGMRTAIDF